MCREFVFIIRVVHIFRMFAMSPVYQPPTSLYPSLYIAVQIAPPPTGALFSCRMQSRQTWIDDRMGG